MAKKIEMSPIRADQFNKMVEMLRDIRRYEYKKYVADLRRKGMSRESALEACIHTMQSIAVGSRGISELKEVGNG